MKKSNNKNKHHYSIIVYETIQSEEMEHPRVTKYWDEVFRWYKSEADARAHILREMDLKNHTDGIYEVEYHCNIKELDDSKHGFVQLKLF